MILGMSFMVKSSVLVLMCQHLTVLVWNVLEHGIHMLGVLNLDCPLSNIVLTFTSPCGWPCAHILGQAAYSVSTVWDTSLIAVTNTCQKKPRKDLFCIQFEGPVHHGEELTASLEAAAPVAPAVRKHKKMNTVAQIPFSFHSVWGSKSVERYCPQFGWVFMPKVDKSGKICHRQSVPRSLSPRWFWNTVVQMWWL